MSATKPKLTPAQRALLTKTFAAMRRHAETFDMRVWMAHEDGGHKASRPYCGTTACLAGHVVLAAGVKPEQVDGQGDIPVEGLPKRLRSLAKSRPWFIDGIEVDYVSVADLAAELIGLGGGWEGQDRLFLDGHWPETFSLAYRRATTPKAKVAAAIARVRHWQTTGR